MIFHQPFNSLSNFSFNTAFYTSEIWEHHFHKNPEIIYVLEGAVDCTINNKNYRLGANDFGLCLPYDIHQYMPEENSRYWVLVFSEDFVSYFSRQIKGKSADGFSFNLKEPAISYIKSQLINNESPTIYSLKSCLYSICEAYLNSVNLSNKEKKGFETISPIVDYISENYNHSLTLDDITKKFGYDYHYMSRLFKKMFNMSFTDFLNIYRLESALNLLENSKKDITAIAYESGFQSVRTFNCFFKKKMNTSPSQYRKASGKQ